MLIDEIAFLTAYLPDKKLVDRVKAALSLLLSQGRGPGFCVIALLQDPRKEVLAFGTCSPPASPCAWPRNPRPRWSCPRTPWNRAPNAT